MPFLTIKLNPTFQISVCNRRLITLYRHWIYEFDIHEVASNSDTYDEQQLRFEKISPKTLPVLKQQNEFSVDRMSSYLLNQEKYVEGFICYDKENRLLGFMWVMYPCGDEFQYRVRETDAFIFDVFVFDSARGKGVCGKMLQYVFQYLDRKKKVSARLGVRKNNASAIRAYEKIGGRKVYSRSFIQLFRKYNMPYYSV